MESLSHVYVVYIYAMLSYTTSQPSYLGILAWYDGLLIFVGDKPSPSSSTIAPMLLLNAYEVYMYATCMLCLTPAAS
jgi:hypothetical protein